VADLSAAEWFGLWVDTASAALLVAMGAFLFSVRPRRRTATWFGLGLSCLGLALLLDNLWNMQLVGDWVRPPMQLSYAVAGVGLLAVAWRYPSVLPRPRRWLLVLPLAAGLLDFATFRVEELGTAAATHATPAEWVDAIGGTGTDFAYGAMVFLLLLLALRMGDANRGHLGRENLAVWPVGAVGSLNLMILAGRHGARFTTAHGAASGIEFALGVLLVSAWAWATAGSVPSASRRARNVTLFLAAAGLVAFLVTMAGGFRYIVYSGLLGASRMAGMGVLAYAILRQQLFDIDIRIKWTLRRGTLLALILLPFLVVQQVIENSFPNSPMGFWAGSVAAGLTLLALNPLQALARVIADKAMPRVRERDPAYLLKEKRETYRQACTAAWGDGTLTREEAQLLADLRLALALPEGDYQRIERDVSRSGAAQA
jgi:hypothetical protein